MLTVIAAVRFHDEPVIAGSLINGHPHVNGHSRKMGAPMLDNEESANTRRVMPHLLAPSDPPPTF
jgi:hypothetical protein